MYLLELQNNDIEEDRVLLMSGEWELTEWDDNTYTDGLIRIRGGG